MSDKNLSVLVIQPWMNYRGAETVAYQLVEDLQKRGIYSRYLGLYATDAVVPNIQVEFLLLPRKFVQRICQERWFFVLFGFIFLLWYVVRYGRIFGVFNPHNFPAVWCAVIVAFWSKQSVVWTVHNFPQHPFRGLIGELYEMAIGPVDRLIVSRVDRIVCVSEKVSQEVMHRYGRESVVVYPGIDTKFFSGLADGSSPIDAVPDDAQVLLQVGQIRNEKCQAFTLRLFEELSKYSDRLYLQFIGEGSIETLQIPYSLSRRVLFSKSMPKKMLSVYYRRATMLIYPSSWGEGCTLVPLEAVAAGCRCIAVCVGCGVDELVEKRLLEGVTFETDVELDVLAKKLSEPLLSLDRVIQSDISFFDRERFANQYVELFNALRPFQTPVQ